MNANDDAEVKSGCSGCLGCFTVVWGLPLLIVSIFVLFAPSPEDYVKRFSLKDGLYTTWMTVDENQNKAKKAFVDKLAYNMKMRGGIDISVPVYKVLENNPKVTNLRIEHGGPVLGMGGRSETFRICYDIEGKRYSLPFLGNVSRSLIKDFGGGFGYVGSQVFLIEDIGPMYGIAPQGIERLLNFFNTKTITMRD